MRKLVLVLFGFSLLATMGIAQDPGKPSRGDILTEKSQIIQEAKAAAEKVTAPIKPETPLANTASQVSVVPSAKAPPATKTDANPPSPLKSATSCGMDVICTLIAR